MKSNKKRQYSKLSKRILNRFFLSLLILLAVMMGGYFLALVYLQAVYLV